MAQHTYDREELGGLEDDDLRKIARIRSAFGIGTDPAEQMRADLIDALVGLRKVRSIRVVTDSRGGGDELV